MKGPGRYPLLLGVVALLLLLLDEACGFSSHSLRIFRLVVSEPSQGLPQFLVVGYVDDQPISHYDSHTRRMRSLAPWMRKVEQDKTRFWDEESQMSQGDEKLFRDSLATLMVHFHHHSSTGGFHNLQLMISCEVWPDGRPGGGRYQYAYDGEDLFAFDKETATWRPFVPEADVLKWKLGSLLVHPQDATVFLEETCLDLLRKFLEYGNETLLRTEVPTVIEAHKKGKDGRETLVCQVYGFYPKEIEVTWMKGGEDRKPETLTGGVLPNSDGTYHTWLSIDVDPEDRHQYSCQVEHDSLPKPQEWWWEKPEWNFRLLVGIAGCLSAAFIILELIAFPTSYLWIVLGILGSVFVATVQLGIFIFPTSKLGLLLALFGCVVASVILLGFSLSFLTSNMRLHWVIIGVIFAASTLLGIIVFSVSHLELSLTILLRFMLILLILQFIISLSVN